MWSIIAETLALVWSPTMKHDRQLSRTITVSKVEPGQSFQGILFFWKHRKWRLCWTLTALKKLLSKTLKKKPRTQGEYISWGLHVGVALATTFTIVGSCKRKRAVACFGFLELLEKSTETLNKSETGPHRGEHVIVFKRGVAFQKPGRSTLLKALCVAKKTKQRANVSRHNLGWRRWRGWRRRLIATSVWGVWLTVSSASNIYFDDYNLCDLYQKYNLGSFNVEMLKSFFSHFESSFKSRDIKHQLVEKLGAMITECSSAKSSSTEAHTPTGQRLWKKKKMMDNELVSIVPDLSRYMAALIKLLQCSYYIQIGKRLFLGGGTSFTSVRSWHFRWQYGGDSRILQVSARTMWRRNWIAAKRFNSFKQKMDGTFH